MTIDVDVVVAVVVAAAVVLYTPDVVPAVVAPVLLHAEAVPAGHAAAGGQVEDGGGAAPRALAQLPHPAALPRQPHQLQPRDQLLGRGHGSGLFQKLQADA